MNETVNEKIKEIKRAFREIMNGVTASSMRQKGMEYKINWGASIVHLRTMANEYGQDYDLAIALWKEDIRECKILATMLMPASQIPEEIAGLWLEQIHSVELVEMLAFNLVQYMEAAPRLAYQWMASEHPLYQICGFHVLSRLFLQGKEPNDRGINEFLDQAIVALQSNNISLRHATLNCVRRFVALDEAYAKMANNALLKLHLDIF